MQLDCTAKMWYIQFDIEVIILSLFSFEDFQYDFAQKKLSKV